GSGMHSKGYDNGDLLMAVSEERSVIVNCDNQSAIHLSRNAMFHERTKHINVRFHFIREIVESKEIELANIRIFYSFLYVEVGVGVLRTLKLDLKSANNGYGKHFVKISAY
ncbi:retrovirus-related pol polyprotein from transposon TNT 1-94, partial [Tanacetum coccineum]